MSNPSPLHALSTMWSQGRFPHKDRDSMARVAATASQLGFPPVEINYVIPPEGVEELLASNHVSIASLHSPTPRVKAADGRWSEALNLAATDEAERSQAVRLACATVGHAVRAGAPAERGEGPGPTLPQARRSLAEMAEHAAGSGVAIGLENRFHYHEFPGLDEMHELLAGYPPDVAGFWLDVGHAGVVDPLGLGPRGRRVGEVGRRWRRG